MTRLTYAIEVAAATDAEHFISLFRHLRRRHFLPAISRRAMSAPRTPHGARLIYAVAAADVSPFTRRSRANRRCAVRFPDHYSSPIDFRQLMPRRQVFRHYAASR
jgi:hypothetical protein